MTSQHYRLLALTSTFLFCLGTLLLFLHPFQQFDVVILKLIQRKTPIILDNPLAVLSVLGNFEIITLPIAFFIWSTKNNKLRLFLTFAYIIGSSIELLSKYSFNHPGPPLQFYRNDLHVTLPTSQISLGSSYPSGHSFRSTFFALIVNYTGVHFHKKSIRAINLTIGVLLLAVLVSRVSLGEHWPSDVVGGFLLATALVCAVFGFTAQKQK